MPPETKDSSPLLVRLNNIKAEIDHLDAEVTQDRDLAAIERFDGTARSQYRRRLDDLKLATERMHRYVAESLAELERVRAEEAKQPVAEVA